jgi:hypothetical protein
MRYRRHVLAALAACLALWAITAALHSLATGAGPPEERPGSLSAFSVLRDLVGSLYDAAPSPVTRDLHLRVPSEDRLLVAVQPQQPGQIPRGALHARAYQWVSRVWSRPDGRRHARGYVRRGTVLHARDRVSAPGCRGAWYTLAGGGVVCSGDGFAVGREQYDDAHEQRKPDATRALPFHYAKVVGERALRFHRIPSEDEEREIARALAAEQRLPEVVEQRLDGVYLLALDHQEQVDTRTFQRTVRGRYVRAEDLELKPEPAMRGTLLEDGRRLPYAFVYGRDVEPAPVYRVEQDAREPTIAGIADNHARIPVLRELEIGARAFVVGPNGVALERAHVRVARGIARPAGIPAGEKWIHVDLAEQTLIAYEDTRPVFATLVSSGKGGEYATPTGLFRIDEKHITTTMRGPDPDEGRYEVEEVPWTQYYHDSYALHGAYWHDTFGEVRSHGCTNIAPIDARWLFYWTAGRLPAGWNALRNFDGTYVYLTDDRT